MAVPLHRRGPAGAGGPEYRGHGGERIDEPRHPGTVLQQPLGLGDPVLNQPLGAHVNAPREQEADEQERERLGVTEGVEHLSDPAQPAEQDAGLALGLEVGEHDSDGLTDDPAAVNRHPEVPAQRQAGLLEVDQLLG